MQIEKVKLESVKAWDKNPRDIKPKDLELLKKQIKKQGVYKPLVCCKENGKYIVLGGNMRLKALIELGVKEIECSVVEAKTEAKKMEYALSDNDRAGFYLEDQLASLVIPEMENFDVNDFGVDLGQSVSIGDLTKAVNSIPNGEEKKLKDPIAECVIEIFCRKDQFYLFEKNLKDWAPN